MRRAAVQAFRSARRPCLRKLVRNRFFVPAPVSHGLVGYRALSSRRERTSSVILTSSMQTKTFIALVSAAVASGAFYAYKGTTPSATPSTADHLRSLSTSGPASGDGESTRRALIVDHQNNLFTATVDGPLSKETDDYGRKVLEMLTPEQATQKLRKNEESWTVGRGQGVVRYDVVQLPSNDPIEGMCISI